MDQPVSTYVLLSTTFRVVLTLRSSVRADLHYKYDKPQSFAIIPSFPSLEAIYGFLHLEATEIKIKHFPNPSVRPLWVRWYRPGTLGLSTLPFEG